jgi:hypothetical protein
MNSFKSRFYPGKRKKWLIFQEQAMIQFGRLSMVVMLLTLLRVFKHQDIFLFALVGFALALVAGNLMAVVSMRRQIAEVFFLQEHFAVLSVWEVLFSKETKTFPLELSNFSREENAASFHYFDRIIVLKAGDWEAFDLICSHLSYRPQI